MGKTEGGGDIVESAVAPDPRAAAEMAAFDALPMEFRCFLAAYPRTAKARQVAALLQNNGNDVNRTMREIEFLLPVRRA